MTQYFIAVVIFGQNISNGAFKKVENQFDNK